MNKFTFLKALNSPFKPFKLKWYVGKVKIGTPYFFPRRWVKATPKLAKEATIKQLKRYKELNKINSEKGKPLLSVTFESIYKDKLRCTYPVPKKIGFDFVDLGWKTKWEHDDYRFEWPPIWSFVFFKWQIAITFIAPEQYHYWSSWLYYYYNTDKTKSKAERIAQCRKEFPQLWSSYKEGQEKETIDYYNHILKKKYL